MRVDPMRVRVLAEFTTPEALRRAVERLREEGYRRVDTYTPYEVPGVAERLGLERTRIPWVAFGAGAAGALLAYLLQWWINVVDLPLDVGGRPPHSAPAFIVITFETVILFAAVAAFVAFFVVSRLPEPWSPLFEVEGFERASVDRFWLGVDGRDPRCEPEATAELLEELAPTRVVRLEGFDRSGDGEEAAADPPGGTP